MIKVQFLKSFAGRKKGDIMELDSLIASDLIRDKIVKKHTAKDKTKNK